MYLRPGEFRFELFRLIGARGFVSLERVASDSQYRAPGNNFIKIKSS